MLEGLAETEHALRQRGLGFVIRLGGPEDVALGLAQRAALVVCDRGYLRPQRRWRRRVAAEAGRRVLRVEGDVVVPVELASTKSEIGARTLRPKLLRERDRFPAPASPSAPRPLRRAHRGRSDVDLTDIPALLARLGVDRSVSPVGNFRGGYKQAKRRLTSSSRGGCSAMSLPVLIRAKRRSRHSRPICILGRSRPSKWLWRRAKKEQTKTMPPFSRS